MTPRATPSRSRAPRLRSRSVLVATAVVLLVAGCDRDVAVGGGEDPRAVEAANAGMDALLRDGRTARRVAAHRLTPERVERWFAAQEALDAQAADDPELGGIASEAAFGDDAIERAVEALEDRPGAPEAIEAAGLSVEDFVMTGLALHQALTASGPAAPAAVRRLAARNVRFVADHAELLSRFRTQRPAYVAEAPRAVDTLGFYYDPFGDSLVYDAAGDVVIPPPDSTAADTTAPPDSLLPTPRDSAGRPPLPVIPPAAPPVPVPVVPPPVPPADTGRPPPGGVPDSVVTGPA